MDDKKSIIAITGPSGAGKTTLGNNLSIRNHLIIPRHCTTRDKRSDDIEGFYRYLPHEKYNELFINNSFLISSGDSEVVLRENGNFYGVLLEDCLNAFEKGDKIVLYVSYKDILALQRIKRSYPVTILNLTFHNIESGVRERLESDISRNHKLEDIEKRIQCALKYQVDYGSQLDEYANTIYTDVNGIEETYQEACKILKL